MKSIIGLFLSLLLAAAFAVPVEEDMTKAETQPSNEIVENFRREIEYWNYKYLELYSIAVSTMRFYRLFHVDLISEIYQGLLTVKGDKIEEVRQAAYELDDLIAAKREELGIINECLQRVINARNAISQSVGQSIQSCAIISNVTLTNNLNDVFYPTFADIQEATSIIQISVIDVLSRGNVLEDEQEILTFLLDRYDALRLQFLVQVSQLLQWESNKFRNEGLFLTSDMGICMDEATFEYLLENSRLEGEVQEC